VAAGGPLANDVVKCALKPLRKADYKVTFTDAEWTQLQKAFPTGVCDYSKPGVSQAPSVPWQSYARGSGGHALGAAPVSMPFHGDIAAAPTSLGSTTQSLPTTGGSAPLSGLAALALLAAAVVRRARRNGAQS
jgi:MYXO-CTERM domain-containing protein